MAGTLDALRDYLGALDAALADPGWDGELPADVDLTAAPALHADEAVAATEMLERMRATATALSARMADATAETVAMEPRRGAARSYLQHASENFSS